MNYLYRAKRNLLIRLLNALGFGGVIAYCICSCDSKPEDKTIKAIDSQRVTDNTAKASDSKSPIIIVDQDVEKKPIPKDVSELEFTIEYPPPDAHVTIEKEKLTICQSSPCLYKFKLDRRYEKLTISAPGYNPHYMLIDKEDFTDSPIKVTLTPESPDRKTVTPKYGVPHF